MPYNRPLEPTGFAGGSPAIPLYVRRLGNQVTSMQLSHVTIRVNDFQSAVAWYQEKLGLEPVGLHDDPFCFMRFPKGDAMIALLGGGRIESEQGVTPAIQVDDLRATVEELKSRGVEFMGDVVDDEEGYRIITMKDLEGNRISLWSN